MTNNVAFTRWSAASAIAFCATAAMAQSNPFYDQPSAQSRAELHAWGLRYVFRMDTGVAAVDAQTFGFSDAAMNSPLFNPLMGAARTAIAATAKNAEVAGCVTEGNLSAANVATDSTAARVRSYLTGSFIGTDIVAEYDLTAKHMETVSAALDAGYAVTAGVQGQELISFDLPVMAVATANNQPPVPISMDPQDIPWIATVVFASHQIASGIDLSAFRAPLTGAPPAESVMLSGIGATLDNVSIPGGVMPYVVHALFGTYGDLPIVVLTYDRGFLLVDAISGNVTGPYAAGTPIDALGLLTNHESYQNGSAVQIVGVSEEGCVAGWPIAGTWHLTPPPGTLAPRPPRAGCPDPVAGPCPPVPSPLPDPGGCTTNPTIGPPPVPGTSRPCFPPANPNVPGWPSTTAYCQAAPGGGCVCRTSGRQQGVPSSLPYPTRTTWTCPSGAMNCTDRNWNFPNLGCTSSTEYWF